MRKKWNRQRPQPMTERAGMSHLGFAKRLERLLHMTREFSDRQVLYGYIDYTKHRIYTAAEQFVESNVDISHDPTKTEALLFKWKGQSNQFGDLAYIEGDSFSGILSDVFVRSDAVFQKRKPETPDISYDRYKRLLESALFDIWVEAERNDKDGDAEMWKWANDNEMSDKEREVLGIFEPSKEEEGFV